jgi:hypothetical protein
MSNAPPPPPGFELIQPAQVAAPPPPPGFELVTDPFEGESFGSLATRRGQQAGQGLTGSVADAAKGAAILGEAGAYRRRENAAAGADERGQTIADIDERLKDPSLDERTREFLTQNRQDLTAGVAELTEQQARPIIPAIERAPYAVGEAVQAAGDEVFGKPDPRDTSFWGQFAQAAGGYAGQVGTTIAAGLVTGPGGALVTGAAQGATINANQLYEEAIEAGASPEDARAVAGAGAVIGLAEVIPITRALKGLPPSIRGKVTNAVYRRLAGAAVSGTEEGLQEAANQIANNLVAQGYYDPERGWSEGVTEAALIGAMLGGGLGATTAGGGEPKREDEVPPDAVAALTSTTTTPPAATPTTGAPGAAEVAPDQAVALARDVMKGARTPAAPAAQAPAAPAPGAVTPQGNEAAPAAPVEPPTVPEAPETIEAQREALVKGTKQAVLYTPGTVLPPELDTKRFNRINIPGVGVIDYDKKKLTQPEIRALAKFGKLNEVLELGPYNKPEVAAAAAAGSPEVAVVEQTPAGVEVKAAAGTAATAPEQVAALEATKTAPENQVVTASPTAVLAERLAQRQVPAAAPTPAPAPAPAAPTPAPVAQQPSSPTELLAALDEQERMKAATTPTPAPAPVTAEAPNPTGPAAPAAPVTPQVTPAPAPKAESAKAVSKAKPKRDPGPAKAEIVGTTPSGGRVFMAPTAPEVREEADEFNEQIAVRGEEKKAKEVSKARSEKREEKMGGPREERLEKARKEIDEGKHKTPAEQARALAVAGGKAWSKKEMAARLQSAEAAAQLQDTIVPDEQFDQITTPDQKKALLRDLKAVRSAAEERGFPFKPVSDIDTAAMVWLKDVDTVIKKLESEKISYEDLNSRLAAWVAAKRGVDNIIRDTRTEEGDARKKKTGNTDSVAAAPSADTAPDEGVSAPADDLVSAGITVVSDVDTASDADAETDTESDVTARVTSSKRTPRLADGSERRKLVIKGKEQEVDAAQGGEMKTGAETTLAKSKSKEELEAYAAALLSMAKSERSGGSSFTAEELIEFLSELTPEQSKFVDLVVEAAAKSDRPASFNALPTSEKTRIYKEMGWDQNYNPMRLFATETVKLREMPSILRSEEFQQEITDSFLSKQDAEVQRVVGPALLDTILEVAGDVDVLVVPDVAMAFAAADNIYGVYSALGDVIGVTESTNNDAGEIANTILHEGAHAVTLAKLKKDPAARARVRALMNMVETRLRQRGVDTSDMNAFKGEDEFLSEAFGSAEFQRQLASIAIGQTELKRLGIPAYRAKVKNAFDAIKAEVARLMGIQRFVRDIRRMGGQSAFDTALDIAGSILDGAPAARAAIQSDIMGILSKASPKKRTPKAAKRDVLKVHTLEKRLESRGLNNETAKQIADMIRAEFEGKASSVELDAIVKRITGEAPKVTSTSNRMERKADAHHQRTLNQIKAAGEKAAEEAMAAAEKDFVPGKDPGKPWLLKVLSNYQIGEVADRYFGAEKNPVRKIAGLIEKRRVTKVEKLKELTPAVVKLMQAQKAHPPAEWEAFTSLVHDATMANVHPDRSLEDNKHLGKKRMSTRWNRSQHADLAARWAALPGSLKDLYYETRDTLTDTHNAMIRGVVQNVLALDGVTDPAVIDRFFKNEPTDADKALVSPAIAEHLEDAADLHKVEGPYFNLVRRGEWVVQGTYKVKPPPGPHMKRADNVFEFTKQEDAEAFADSQTLRSTIRSLYVDKKTGETFFVEEDGTETRVHKEDGDNAERRFRVTVQNKHVEFTDTEDEARARTDALKKDGVEMKDVEVREFERTAQNSELMSDQMRAISKTLDKRKATSDLSEKQKAELQAALFEISINFLGSTRIQSSMRSRRYIEGASKDLARNTFEYIDRASGYLAKLETAPALEAALEDLQKRKAKLSAEGTGAGTGASMIVKEIESRVYRPFDIDDGFLQNATTRALNIAYIDALASPAYTLIQTTQVGMFTMPVLSADFNPVSAGYQLGKAYKDLGALRILGGGIADTGRAAKGIEVTGDRYIDDVMKRLTEPRERQLVEALTSSGLFDASGGMEIARVLNRRNDAKFRKNPGRWLGQKGDLVLQYADNIARAMPQSAEAINRGVSGLAAYRLHFNKHKNHERAVQYAMDVVNDTQALMSNSNSAPIFSAPVWRISLQFKKFGQMAYYLLGKNIGRVFKPMEKGDRLKGAKALAYLTATHATFAGVVGVPGLEALKIGLMLFNGFVAGAGEEIEWEEFENWVEEYMAKLTGSDTFGEMLTFGVTRGIGGGWAFDLNARLGADSMLTFGEPRRSDSLGVKSYMWDTVAGPAGRTVADAMSGTAAAIDGDFSKMGRLIPFKMLADTNIAITKRIEGEMDTQDMILRVIGLQSGRQANISQQVGSNIRGRREATAERDSLVNAYIEANSASELQEARRAIQRFNRSAKDGQRPITTRGLDEIRRDNRLLYAD